LSGKWLCFVLERGKTVYQAGKGGELSEGKVKSPRRKPAEMVVGWVAKREGGLSGGGRGKNGIGKFCKGCASSKNCLERRYYTVKRRKKSSLLNTGDHACDLRGSFRNLVRI